MASASPWNLLRAGKGEQEQGLQQVQQAHAQCPDASAIVELGVAYLWLRQYRPALEHFHVAIETHRTTMSTFYGMAGVAKWCLGEPGEAVLLWRDGLKAKYADTNGLGVRIPLLLFLASVVKPETFERSSAETLLMQKAKDARIRTWPGPIVKLVLGQVNESDFASQCKCTSDSETRGRHWMAEFYGSVLQHDHVKTLALKESMRKLTDTSQPEWGDEDFFLRRMWNEEFFLARHEAN